MDPRLTLIDETGEFLREKAAGFKPEIGIVLGSGLGKFGDSIEAIETIPYADIPNFAHSTAIGHKGNFIIGKVAGKVVCAMQGRFHFYEGYPMEQVTFPIRVMARMGVKTLFVSNAAGGVNPGFKIGDLMIIDDHINTMPNPLIGPNHELFGERFLDMSCAYDREIIAKAEAIAAELGSPLKKGVTLPIPALRTRRLRRSATTAPSAPTLSECPPSRR